MWEDIKSYGKIWKQKENMGRNGKILRDMRVYM